MLRQQSQLHTEMETVKNFRKLTPEERKKHLQEETFRELRQMEMERRARVAQEELERCRREKEERDKEIERFEEERRRQEAKQREEDMRKASKEEELKNERLHWKKVMMVPEEPIRKPRFTLSDLKKEQQRRREEAEAAESSFKSLRRQEQSPRKTLINNWVREQVTPREISQEELHQTSSTHHTSAERPSLKSQTTQKSSRALHWLQKRLKSGLFSKKQDEAERKQEACRLKDLYGKNRSSLSEQVDSYRMSRNSILKKSLY